MEQSEINQNLTITVLINNFNYECFVNEAIESVLMQTHRVDQLVIVDDGSTDDSVAVIRKAIAEKPNAQLITQKNQGQLGCIQRGILEASGDIIFFLDADDRWMPNHIESYIKTIHSYPEVDFIFSGHKKFGLKEDTVCNHPKSIFLGFSPLITLFGHCYVGSITSTIAIRRELLLKYFPLEDILLNDWKICADDVLVLGASIFSGVKYYLNTTNVEYRMHADNKFYNYKKKKKDPLRRFKKKMNWAALIEHFRIKACIPYTSSRFLIHEFHTIPKPDRRYYGYAVAAAKNLGLSLHRYFMLRLRLWLHYKGF